MQIHVGTSLVQQVDGFVRQEPVRNVPLRKDHALAGDFRRNRDPMKLGIGFGNALEDLAGLFDVGLRHTHRLEPALQSRILFDVLSVFIIGRRADDLNFSPGQGRLQNIGSIHAAFRVSGSHQIVDFVNDQDDVAALLDFGNQALHPALELTTELSTCHQGGQIQQKDLLVPKLVGYIPLHDPLGQALGNGGLAHAGFAHQAGIVFLAAVQNLNDPLCLHIPADDLVQLALPGPGSQIHAVVIQELMLALFGLFLLLSGTLLLLGSLTWLGQIPAEKLVHQGEGCGLAVCLVLFPFGGIPLAEHRAHFIGDHIQVFIGKAHLLHRLVNLGNTQAPGALHAVALVQRNAIFHLGDENHRHILLAFTTHFWLHSRQLLQRRLFCRPGSPQTAENHFVF